MILSWHLFEVEDVPYLTDIGHDSSQRAGQWQIDARNEWRASSYHTISSYI